jgi:hypothetical protein
MNTRTPLRVLAALALLAAATSAHAAGTHSARSDGGIGSTTIDGFLVLDPGPDGVGAGFRVSIPLARGPIQNSRVRDEFVLEPGMDFVHYHQRLGWYPYYESYDWNGLLFVVGGAWQFWLTPNFALYPKIDLGWWYGWNSGWHDRYGYHHDDYGGSFLQIAGGLIYRINRLNLRAELGSDLIRLGIGVAF